MIAYLDCASGVSGDKLLAAFVDAGFPEASLAAVPRLLGLEQVAVATERVSRRGISALALEVSAGDQPRRTWREIEPLLRAAELPGTARATALTAFRELADAEAAVHGVAVEDVHFHEIGAADTLVDIVGVALAAEALGVRDVVVSPIAVGSGTVMTEHGELPVPAPATAALLRGLPVFGGTETCEMTTPTGAALLRALAARPGPLPPSTVAAIGYGAGTRDTATPNVLRVMLAEPLAKEAAAMGSGADLAGLPEVVVLEANVDDATGEQLAFAAERLLEEGALDAWQQPLLMKKGRAGVLVAALARPDDAARLAALLARLTGSLGVRIAPARRLELPRRVEAVVTPFGSVRVKIAEGALTVAERLRPEYEDCAAIARERDLPVAEVMRMAVAEAERAGL